MPGLFYPFILLLGLGIVISLYLIARLWTTGTARGSRYLIWAIASVAVWSFGTIFEILASSLGAKSIWLVVEYLGIPFTALAFFLFILVYSGRDHWLRWPRLALLSIIPGLTVLLALTNQWHHWLWGSLLLPPSAIGQVQVSNGIGFFISTFYSTGLILLGSFFLVQLAIRQRDEIRTTALIMLAGLLLPWAAAALNVLRLGLDFSPLAFSLTAVVFAIAYLHQDLSDLIPATEEQILRAFQHGIVMTDPKGRIVKINPSAERLFQRRGKNLIGTDIHQLFPAWTEWNTQIGNAFEASHEITLNKGPAQRTFEVKIAPILEGRGQVTGQITTLIDITDEKQAQSQMRLQSTALEAAENGIFITDAQGRIEWANPAFLRLTGYELYEVLGKNPKFLKSGRQESEFYQSLWETILAGNVWHGDLVNRRKDGSLYFEEMTITSLMEDGHPSHFIAIKQDVTIRKEAEEQLRQAHEQALEANRMKTQLLASVSHDLRTPLGTIMGYAEMLQSATLGKVNAEQKNAAVEILDSANRLLGFVNNLIGQAQLETGRIVLRPRYFKPSELSDGIHSLVGLAAKKKGLKLEVIIDPDLPEQICADPYWLKQILYNLVNNAVKFTHEGSVTIRFFSHGESQWAIQVTDSGMGISEKIRSAIFEPFRRGDKVDMTEGSGLGLSIVSQLTALMKGKIELETEVGQGSTFTVILPLLET